MTSTPSTYLDRYRALGDAFAAIDRTHPAADGRWREARRAAMARTLLDAIGVDPDHLDDQDRRTIGWLTGCDAEAVAGVCALLDRAAGR